MNVLFVCTQNMGRSQMAAALYNSLVTKTNGRADSAGTRVDAEGQTLAERAKENIGAANVLIAMNDVGMDLSHKKRHAVTKEMLDDYDQIIVMAEPDTIPRYLHDHAKAVYWDIASPPLDGLDGIREVRDELKRKIVDLIDAVK